MSVFQALVVQLQVFFFLISQCYAASEKWLGQPSLQLVDVVQDFSAIMLI
jgi:hypothetical protein